MYYVAVYDVNVDRVGKMLKIFRKYLTWVQNSVFEGELTDAQFERLKAEAAELMNPEEDAIIFWSVQNRKFVDRDTLGGEKGLVSRML
jgi:CRISPR-associated protein Cas2